ncbi:hypothetical protein A0H81_04396 [Grifola frondosa]|uniref:Tumor susceptibility gene 101 protein n=1 Tax=Grifola frondosa TaxID=5627 RepID=A0A1C7MES6_GRIFR|nr:hypothetical protein A0H81_04396 [Grifola frondosa]
MLRQSLIFARQTSRQYPTPQPFWFRIHRRLSGVSASFRRSLEHRHMRHPDRLPERRCNRTTTGASDVRPFAVCANENSMNESLTHKWLRQNIQPYPNRDIVFFDVDAVLARHPTIRPKTDVYIYDDGRTQLLLCLHGLLPISFHGTSYNIPVAIWITREYPRKPPIAYVVPTTDMLVRPGEDVDVSGRCLLEYIRNWERKSEGCNMAALLDAMREAFSRRPPVYAKPKSAPSPQPSRPRSSTPDYSGRPPPPLPDASAIAPISPASMHVAHNDGRPPLPAKPGSSASNAVLPPRIPSVPLAQPQAANSGRSQTPSILGNPAAALAMRPPPPLPPHLHSESPVSVHHGTSPILPTYTPHTRSASADIVTNPPTWSQGNPANVAFPQDQLQPVYSRQQTRLSPPPLPAIPSELHTGSLPPLAGVQRHAYSLPLSPPGSVQTSPPHPPPTFISPQPTVGISPYGHHPSPPVPPPLPPVPSTIIVPSPPAPPPPPALPPPDLLDTEEDIPSVSASPSYAATAPPRPPNPELLHLHAEVHTKLSSELASLSQAMALDAERLRANQADLLTGEPAIRDEMARLEAVRDVCRSVARRLGDAVSEGERNVAELRRKGDPEVDEMVCSTTIVYNQLINLVAEDNAIEDTIYHLHRALNSGRIDLERFLRTTRVLAEEQFMKRALTEKIQAGIPLGDLLWIPPPDWR